MTDQQAYVLDEIERPVTVTGDEEHRRGKAGMAHAFTCSRCGRRLASDDPTALRDAANKHVDQHAA